VRVAHGGPTSLPQALERAAQDVVALLRAPRGARSGGSLRGGGLRLRRGGLLDRGRRLGLGVLQLVLVPLPPVAAAPARTAVPSTAPPVLVAGGGASAAPGRLDLVLPVV